MINKSPLLITIITPSYNRAGMIRAAIESVLAQNCLAVEHIVIDSGSTDGTLTLLKRYSHLRVISEPDGGMYDALNKGLHLACGEIVGLLNSDDYYEPHVFAAIIHMFEQDPELDAVIGGARVFHEENGREETLAIHPAPSASQLAERLTLGVPAINAWCFRRRVFEKLEGFDLRYRVASDRDFLIRFLLQGFKAARYDGVLYHYRQHSRSLTFSDDYRRRQQFKLEDLEIAETYIHHLPLRKACLAWHLSLSLNSAAEALRHGDIRLGLRMAWHGWRRNPLWPLYFLRDALRGAGRSLRR